MPSIVNSCAKIENNIRIASVRFGSTAARRRHSSSTAASRCIPALQLSIFHFANLNVCFSQQRPFRAEENYENDGQLTARRRRSGRQVQRIVSRHSSYLCRLNRDIMITKASFSPIFPPCEEIQLPPCHQISFLIGLTSCEV